MGIIYSRDLQCDKCLTWVEGTTHRHVTNAQIRAELKGCGWTQRRIHGRLKDLCPKCSEAMKGKNKW